MHLPHQRMTFVKNNANYYKPGSLAAAGVGGRGNRGLLNYKKRRTSGILMPMTVRPRSAPGDGSTGHLGLQSLNVHGNATFNEVDVLGTLRTHSHVQTEGDHHVGGDSTTDGDHTTQGTATAGSFVVNSDRRLKSRIEPLGADASRKMISSLRPASYAYKHDESSATHTGFIAQEVHDAAPHLVREGQDGYLQLNTLEMVPYLVREVQSLRAQVDELSKGKS